MTHSFHIANLVLTSEPTLRPASRGQAVLACAYRPCHGDRKELLPAIC